jgi:hypothetical protein
MSVIDLPSKEELIARSEHLGLAVETAFREWLLGLVLARETSPEFLSQLMRINQKIDELKLKKAMIQLKEREVSVKERGIDLKQQELDLKAREADRKAREVDLKAQIAADDRGFRDREVAVKEQRLEYQKSLASAKSAKEPAAETVQSPPRAFEPTTEELVAMEWDLRSFLQFGDLRPFDWFTGLKTIYFPDRSAHPAAPVPNYPDDIVRTESMVARPDGVFILMTPVSELPKDWEKMVVNPADKPPYTPVPPVIENGQVQWQLFIKPAYPHTNFPYNTLLPEGWVYGDPIPGMPEEFA